MKTCPNCLKEVPDLDWNCPYCGYHFPCTTKGTGHATSGDFGEDDRFPVSGEDDSMIRDKNHNCADGDDDIEADEPYTVSTHEDF